MSDPVTSGPSGPEESGTSPTEAAEPREGETGTPSPKRRRGSRGGRNRNRSRTRAASSSGSPRISTWGAAGSPRPGTPRRPSTRRAAGATDRGPSQDGRGRGARAGAQAGSQRAETQDRRQPPQPCLHSSRQRAPDGTSSRRSPRSPAPAAAAGQQAVVGRARGSGGGGVNAGRRRRYKPCSSTPTRSSSTTTCSRAGGVASAKVARSVDTSCVCTSSTLRTAPPKGGDPDRRARGPIAPRALCVAAGRRHQPDPRQHLPRSGAERAARDGGGLRRHRHAQERGALPRRRAVRPGRHRESARPTCASSRS